MKEDMKGITKCAVSKMVDKHNLKNARQRRFIIDNLVLLKS